MPDLHVTRSPKARRTQGTGQARRSDPEGRSAGQACNGLKAFTLTRADHERESVVHRTYGVVTCPPRATWSLRADHERENAVHRAMHRAGPPVRPLARGGLPARRATGWMGVAGARARRRRAGLTRNTKPEGSADAGHRAMHRAGPPVRPRGAVCRPGVQRSGRVAGTRARRHRAGLTSAELLARRHRSRTYVEWRHEPEGVALTHTGRPRA